jgi:hypothetical protein
MACAGASIGPKKVAAAAQTESHVEALPRLITSPIGLDLQPPDRYLSIYPPGVDKTAFRHSFGVICPPLPQEVHKSGH